MAIKTNAELTAQNDAYIRVNGNREITPPKHNEFNKNVVDSFLNIKDGGQVVQVQAGYSSALALTNPTSFVYKSWVENLVSSYGSYQGLWDANTNTPTITSGVGTNGDYYYVSVSGTTTIDGISTWTVGDKIVFNGTAWERLTALIDLSIGVTGILPVVNGGTGNNDYTLKSSTNVDSIDWDLRLGYDSNADLSVNWDTKKLYNGTATVFDWSSGVINDQNGVGIISLNTNLRKLYNTAGDLVADYNLRYLYYNNGTTQSLDWINGLLHYGSGQPSVWWSNGTLHDSGGNITVDYLNKEFWDNFTFITQKSLRFNDLDNTNYVGIKAPTNVVSNYDISLPANPPLSNTYLGYNGSAYVWQSLTSGLTYLGTWNASTNTPAITSGVGSNGEYYVVSVAGTTTIDGINDWGIGDWIVFNGTAWQKIDNSEMATTWGSITGTITSQTDLITYLSTNYQPLATNLTSLSGLTYASTSFVKMTAAGAFALDTNTYALNSALASYQPLDADLTAIAALTGTSGFLKTNGAGTWSVDTNTYVTSSGLSGYALLNGSNTPFTGNIDITTNYSGGRGQLRVTSPSSGNASFQLESSLGAGNSVLDLLSVSNDTYFRMFRGSYAGIVMEMVSGASTTTFSSGSGNRNMSISSTGTGSVKIKGSHGGVNGNEINIVNGTGLYFVTQNLFYAQNDAGTNIMQWTASTSELKLRLSSVDRIIFNPNSQNSGIFNNGIKFANNTDSAATAGGGSFKYASASGYYSNASNWLALVGMVAGNTKVTAGAPYTNDGYIEVTIEGNTYKLMTTA
jgi:hypothetical protein